ncbi:MAG: OsmC family protein [Rhodopirellula sp.]|nr:OsmC family protein [Rhodopirellula sp.]
MNAEELRAAQAPIKEQYKSDPQTALKTMTVTGIVQPNQTCRLNTAAGPVDAGLHPAAGGSGVEACSGDMLLEALVACAGVTFSAVATAMEISIEQASITAEGDLDFRGTLGVSRDVPIGFSDIRLKFDVKSTAPQEKIDKLIQLTERYCVIYQTLRQPMDISTHLNLNAD